MATSKIDKAESQKAQGYAELYHLLVRGMETLNAFTHSTKESRSSAVGQQLERAYILLRRDFLELHDKLGLGEPNDCVFSIIQRLGGAYTAEYIEEWLEGYADEPRTSSSYPYGGKHKYEDELANIAERAYLAGVENINNQPCKMHYKTSYDLAYEAIKGVKAKSLSEYTLTWGEENDEVLVNGVYKLTSVYANSGSNTSRLLEEIKVAQDGKENKTEVEFDFRPSGTRTTAQTLTDLGITPMLRKIFFPKGTRGNHIRFRSPVKKKTLEIEGVDLDKLYKEVDLPIIESQIKKDQEAITS